jgi:BirA family biotin operon repressor/biotin-[acetyl-CoA-carboxylase] ligase
MAKKHDIIWLESADSTNEECKRHISDLDNLSVVAALSQTCGKGQRGNVWISDPGKNLTFSIVLKFPFNVKAGLLEPMHAYDQFVFSEIAALAVVDLLAEHGIQAKIKWPNDIYIGDRKICGILIENSLRGEWIQHSIIGIGLNVNQRNFDVTLSNPTSMMLCGEFSCASGGQVASDSVPHYELQDLLEEFMNIFRGYLDRYCHIRGGYGRLRHMYLSHLWRKDEPAQFIDRKVTPSNDYAPCRSLSIPCNPLSSPDADTNNPPVFTGIIRGLSDAGLLIVEMHDGTMQEFTFKEISYYI